MKYLIFLFISLLVFGCSEPDYSSLPACIAEGIKNNSEHKISSVYILRQNGETQYWPRSEVISMVSTQYTLSEQCDTICTWCGECSSPGCETANPVEWELLWEN